MGQTFVEALVRAMRLVVAPDVTVEATTRLEQTTLDSLGLLETFVHLEAMTGDRFDEETLRSLALDPSYDPSMTVAAFAALVRREVDRNGGDDRIAANTYTVGEVDL